jgi:hypothetical protein
MPIAWPGIRQPRFFALRGFEVAPERFADQLRGCGPVGLGSLE